MIIDWFLEAGRAHAKCMNLIARIEQLKTALREISELGDIRSDEASQIARAALSPADRGAE